MINELNRLIDEYRKRDAVRKNTERFIKEREAEEAQKRNDELYLHDLETKNRLREKRAEKREDFDIEQSKFTHYPGFLTTKDKLLDKYNNVRDARKQTEQYLSFFTPENKLQQMRRERREEFDRQQKKFIEEPDYYQKELLMKKYQKVTEVRKRLEAHR